MIYEFDFNKEFDYQKLDLEFPAKKILLNPESLILSILQTDVKDEKWSSKLTLVNPFSMKEIFSLNFSLEKSIKILSVQNMTLLKESETVFFYVSLLEDYN